MSVAFATALTVFSLLLITLSEFDAIFPQMQSNSIEILLQEYHQRTEYSVLRLLFGGLTVIGILASAYFIHHVMLLNQSERAQTLSRLTLLGGTKWHKSLFVVSDAILYAPAALLLGVPLGILLVMPSCRMLCDYLAELHGYRAQMEAFIRAQMRVGRELLLLCGVALLSLLGGCLPAALRARKSGVLALVRTEHGVEIALRQGLLDKLLIRCFGEVGRLCAASHYNNRRHYRGISVVLSSAATLLLFFVMLMRYVTQSWTEAEQSQERWTLIFGSFAVMIFIMAMVVGFCMFVVQFHSRAWEFSLYRSLGMRDGSLRQLLLLEGLRYGVHVCVLTVIVSLICNAVLYAQLLLVMDGLIPHYPLLPTLAVLGVILLFSLSLSLYMLSRTRRTSVIEGIRSTIKE